MALDAMKQRQQRARRMWIVVIALLLVGILALVALILLRVFGGNADNGSGIQIGGIFTTPTSTPTFTNTPITPTLTVAPTETETPTVTPTETPSGPQKYVVQEGDTVFSIADKHDVFISQLNAFNLEQGIDLSAGVLRVGQEIFIPVQDYQAPTSTPFPDTIKPGTKIDYIVQAGDILESIASEFKTTISAIQEANPGETETLDVGQVLKVPYNVFALTPIIPTATSIPTRAPTPTP